MELEHSTMARDTDSGVEVTNYRGPAMARGLDEVRRRSSAEMVGRRGHLARAQVFDSKFEDRCPITRCAASDERKSRSTRVLDIRSTRPLSVMFALTSMPVGGAEILVKNLMDHMDPARFAPRICCLKELGPLGEHVAERFPATSELLSHKYDLRILPRLVHQMKGQVDALVTVGAGDKMFWGRIAARVARVPVVLSALHSTGWPDGIGRLNRLLTPWTDAFVAVAPEHGRHLVEHERLPREKVRVIFNGVDTQRFQFDAAAPSSVRRELDIPANAPLCGIVAALRPEKNHALFLRMAEGVLEQVPGAHFVIVGDGPQASELRAMAAQSGWQNRVHFLGTRSDVPRLLAALNVFTLTSRNEANPVSILEALSVQVPVVATNVGSVSAAVKDGVTGFLVEPNDVDHLTRRVVELLRNATLAKSLGDAGRQEVTSHWSLDRMVRGYEQLIIEIYQRKRSGPTPEPTERVGDSVEFCGATS